MPTQPSSVKAAQMHRCTDTIPARLATKCVCFFLFCVCLPPGNPKNDKQRLLHQLAATQHTCSHHINSHGAWGHNSFWQCTRSRTANRGSASTQPCSRFGFQICTTLQQLPPYVWCGGIVRLQAAAAAWEWQQAHDTSSMSPLHRKA